MFCDWDLVSIIARLQLAKFNLNVYTFAALEC